MRYNMLLEDLGITEDELKAIKTYVMILYAERDMIKEDHILNLAGLIPGAVCRRIEVFSHMTIPFKSYAVERMRSYLLGK